MTDAERAAAVAAMRAQGEASKKAQIEEARAAAEAAEAEAKAAAAQAEAAAKTRRLEGEEGQDPAFLAQMKKAAYIESDENLADRMRRLRKS